MKDDKHTNTYNTSTNNTEYDFIIDNITFSYSSITTFENCKYGFKLAYIDKKERVNNFFGEYGTLVHNTLELYFDGTLENYELSGYFKDMYYETMVSPPPPYPAGMEENYIEQAEKFFDEFYFPVGEYDIVSVEDTLWFDIDGTNFTGRPDLILKEKETNERILTDFKTSKINPTLKSWDKKKIEGYHKQMLLYIYGFRKAKDIKIDKIMLWFTRPDRKIFIPWTQKEEDHTLDWIRGLLKDIRSEKEFEANTSSDYFCNYLCGVREHCEYRG